MNKLTKKEQEFLLDWLSDDLPKIILKLKLTTKTRSK
jgi:hypothetical protein